MNTEHRLRRVEAAIRPAGQVRIIWCDEGDRDGQARIDAMITAGEASEHDQFYCIRWQSARDAPAQLNRAACGEHSGPRPLRW